MAAPAPVPINTYSSYFIIIVYIVLSHYLLYSSSGLSTDVFHIETNMHTTDGFIFLPFIGCPFQNQTTVASGMAKAEQLKEMESPSVTVTLPGRSGFCLKIGTAENTIKLTEKHRK